MDLCYAIEVNGTELSAQEYRDAFLLRYGRCPEISNLIVMVVARRIVFTCT
jgi:hypothetical protein